MLRYEVKAPLAGSGIEYEDEAEAVAAAEKMGRAQVIAWYVERNLPGALPEFVYRSTALRSFADGAWTDVDIHGR